jgi:hypothetical protein
VEVRARGGQDVHRLGHGKLPLRELWAEPPR